MTDTESKLAAIERLPEGTYRDTKGIGWHGTVVSPSQLEWLIAEVRRLREAIMDVGRKAEQVILESAELAVKHAEDEYARGREDEREKWAEQVKRLKNANSLLAVQRDLARAAVEASCKVIKPKGDA